MILFPIVGCTWIGDEDLEERKPYVDDDNDGVLAKETATTKMDLVRTFQRFITME